MGEIVALVDYGAGNLHSVENALRRVGATVKVTADPDVLRAADRIVLPGVGSFRACAEGLRAEQGVIEAMRERVFVGGAPFLGICVGMQLLATRGLEHGETPGLGWIDGAVRKIEPSDISVKVPHMGWNDLILDSPHPVFNGIKSGDHAYFVHSYHMQVSQPEQRLAHVGYDGEITAIIGRDNLLGMQFHPEKSQKTGLKLIANFLKWAP